MFVRHGQQVKAVRILIAGLERLLEKANRVRPSGIGDGGNGDDFVDVGHSKLDCRFQIAD